MSTGKIKVLQVNKMYAPHTGGVEKVVQQVAEGLKDKVDMKVLVCREKGKTRISEVNGVNVIYAGSLGTFFSMPVSFSFFHYFRKLSYDRDIIHIHMPFPLADIACLLSGFKGRVVLWWHSDIVRQKHMMMFYRPFMYKLLERADCIVVATEGHINGSKYIKQFREKCIIIPYGTNIEPCKCESAEQISSIFSGFGISKKVLFVGRLVYYKGVNILLDAFRKVYGAQLYIVGDGTLRSSLEAQAAELGINDKVFFLGSVDDEKIRVLLSYCDIFVLPSVAESEAFGLVQIEAMACSKPVINTALPTGVPYVSLNEETGLTVPPGDSDALANAIQRLVNSEADRLKFGENARERTNMHFKLDNMNNSVFKLYNDLIT